MTWQNVSHQWPSQAQTIQTQSVHVLGQVGDVMNASVSRMAGLANQVSVKRHPLSQEAEAIRSLRGELEQLLCQGQVLSVHPYQYQVGHKVESGHHLSPDVAVQALAAKLMDGNDKQKPTGQQHALGWMIAESSLADFAKSTQALFEVVNLPELGMVTRRLAQEQRVQTDKFIQPNPIAQPRFKPMASLNPRPLRHVLNWQGGQLAHIESLAADWQSPVDKLGQLAQKRDAQLQAWQGAIDGLKQSDVTLLKFEGGGTREVIATLLNQSQPPSRANRYTFASLFLSPEPLSFLSELFA